MRCRGARLLTLYLWACTPDARNPSGPRPRIVDGPTLVAPPEVPLSRELHVTTDVPTRLTAHLTSDGVDLEVSWPDEGTEHVVPLLGAKPDRTTTVDLELVAADGQRVEATTSFVTAPLEDPWVELDVVSADVERVDPGYVLLPLQTPDGLFWLAAVDLADGEPAWIYRGDSDFGDVRVTPDGTLLGLSSGVLEMTTLGVPIRRMVGGSASLGPGDVRLPVSGLHHELHPLGEGRYASLTHREATLDPFPVSYASPEIEGTGTTEDDAVVVFDDDGDELGEWWFSDLLDTMHIGFDSLDGEWSHGNAVIPGLTPGGLVAEARHLDTLFEVSPAGEVRWILSDPAGWQREPWTDLLLTPVGDVQWPLHPHGPSIDADGRLLVFDNGDDGHTPYEPPSLVPERSRVIAYDIDPEARTVSTAWTWEPPGDRLYSAALGNASATTSGHVIACYGFLDGEGDELNADAGRGRKSIRVFELVPGEADPIADVRIWLPLDAWPEGVKAYRAVPTPSLYPADVTVTWNRGG